MRIKIDSIEYYLPEKVVTNADLGAQNLDWDISLLEVRTGVARRHIANSEETALDFAIKACEKLLINNSDLKSKIDGIIFCTESEDYIIPPNSCLLHKAFDLDEKVFAFDFNLACSGYIYGLALAQGLIFSKQASNVLLVNADTYSKYIHKQDRATRVLFGDGAAVSLINESLNSKGIMDIQCATSGKHYDKFIIPAGGCRMPKSNETGVPEKDKSGNTRTKENIRMDGFGILTFVNSKVPQQIHNILERNKLTLSDIDLFVFHQASNMALDSLQRQMKIKPEKVFRNLKEVGNLVSASIPVALKDAIDQGLVKPGNKILISGFGVGLSWGTAIIEF